MRHRFARFAVLLLLSQIALADDKPESKNLAEIQPPGGVQVLGGKGTEITPAMTRQLIQRLEAVPEGVLDKWLVELERITDKKIDDASSPDKKPDENANPTTQPEANADPEHPLDLEKQGCRTYIVNKLSIAFNDLDWNAEVADKLFARAQSMSADDCNPWTKAFEVVLKEPPFRLFAVPLVLIPVDALFKDEKYDADQGKKYLARLKQLNADDVRLWQDKIDQFHGSDLDAAVNIIPLDEFFENETFQREKLKEAAGVGNQ